MNKNHFMTSLYETAHVIFKFKPLKAVVFPIYKKIFIDPGTKKRNAKFHQYALEALTEFHKCMEKNKHPYTLMFGTLLGAIREHGFIKHDLDIDTSMWWNDYTPEIEEQLKEYGFTMVHVTTVDDGKYARHECYRFKEVTLDIFYIYPPVDKLPFTCDYALQPDCATETRSIEVHGGLLPRRIELPFTRERELIPFLGIQVYIPTNAHELMRCRYGESYMTPNPDIRTNHVHPVDWYEKIGVVKLFS